MEELKKLADELGIKYAGNVSKADLTSKIEAKRTAMAAALKAKEQKVVKKIAPNLKGKRLVEIVPRYATPQQATYVSFASRTNPKGTRRLIEFNKIILLEESLIAVFRDKTILNPNPKVSADGGVDVDDAARLVKAYSVNYRD